jgi:signal transduction histidine kinase
MLPSNGFLARLRRSLGLRLVALFLVLATAITFIFLGGMQRALSGGWSSVARPLVVDYVDRLAAELGSPPDPARAAALVRRLPLSIRIEGPAVQFDSNPDRTDRKRRYDEGYPAQDFDQHDGAWWLLTRVSADGHRITFGLGDAAWRQRPRFIGWLTLGLLLALTAGAYLYVRRLFKPIDDIRAGVRRYGDGDFALAIPQRRKDELGELAGQVNQMAQRLQQMLDAKRALLLAISHELRSPLTRARLNAELVADGEPRDALLRDLAEMRDLITDLLESERLSAGHAALQREPTDLEALARALLAERFAGVGLQLHIEGALPELQVDRTRLRLLLRNLLDNALRHGGGAARPPELRLAAAGSNVAIVVRDFGPGVTAEELTRLAEPFHRGDPARQRSTGGVGLGLYLCRLVAQAHGGSLTLRNASPGLEITVVLPG